MTMYLRRPFLLFVLLSVALGLAVPPARAQYMFLDSNGDGVHTAADVITATGTTNFDIWLRTDKNRDGSTATCAVESAPLTINSYEVLIVAEAGTVSWQSVANLQPTMSLKIPLVPAQSSSEIYFGFLGGTILPPGDYKLCRVAISVGTGTPSLRIGTPPSQIHNFAQTAFGCGCSGNDRDNTMKLGGDWFDADGLAFSAGGGSNAAPSLSGGGPLVVPTGESGAEDIVGADSDGDLVRLTLTEAPAFVTMVPLTSLPGTSTSRVHAKPRRGDAGSHSAVATATDGLESSAMTISVSVTPGGDHPPILSLPERVRIVAGSKSRLPLYAKDTDGDAILYSKVSGPAFARVTTYSAGGPATTGSVLLEPSACDLGESPLTILASNGYGATEATVVIDVLAATTPSPAPPPPIATNLAGITVADLDSDGFQDIAAVQDRFNGSLLLYRGDGSGGFTLTGQVPVGLAYSGMESGDWNHDGITDLAVGAFTGSPVKVFYGAGAGVLHPPVEFPGLTGATELRRVDLNRDSIDDLVGCSEGTEPFTLLGTSSGLVLGSRIPLGFSTKDLTTADFDADGDMDLALSGWFPNQLHVLRGRGDGTFAAATTISQPASPFGIAAADFDEDGRPDLVVSSYGSGDVSFLRGLGNGNFAPAVTIGQGFGETYDAVATDWNADGHTDVFCSSQYASRSILLGNGDGSFIPGPIVGSPGIGYDAVVKDINHDARPDLVVAGGSLRLLINQTPFSGVAASRAFQANPQRALPAVSSASTLCLRVEPSEPSFTLQDIDPLSFRLSSVGTGSVEQILAVAPKSGVVGDTDGNSIQEVPVCFAMADVANLFSNLRGRKLVEVSLAGRLLDGRQLC
jgi:hypothetical protein